MLPELYRHTQIGYVLLVALGAGLLLILALMSATGLNWVGLAVLLFLACCLAFFATLTTRVDPAGLEIWFGPGLLRRRFTLDTIAACRVVRNRWYYGWGIHLTPSGWLYNVSGLQAVELTMKNGKKVRIGTDDPAGLAEAIELSRRG